MNLEQLWIQRQEVYRAYKRSLSHKANHAEANTPERFWFYERFPAPNQPTSPDIDSAATAALRYDTDLATRQAAHRAFIQRVSR